MNGSIRTWTQRLVAHGANSLKNAVINGCKSPKRLIEKSREYNRAERQDDYFPQWVRAELRHVVNSIDPQDALSDIRKRIRGHPMKLYKVTAVKTDKAPDYWPFESVVMVTRAVTNDWAVEIGKETIGLIEI